MVSLKRALKPLYERLSLTSQNRQVRDPATGVVAYEEWWRDGKRHREDGPAIIKRDPATGVVAYEECWRDGKRLDPPRQAPAPIPPQPL